MIEVKRITTREERLYNYMENLLTASFPKEEYRELDLQRKNTDTLPEFHCNVIFDDTLPIGLITYWDLKKFYYIEHFAVDPAHRNGGLGKKILDYLSGTLPKPVVLEVEPPVEEMAKRRINFYERQGFILWEKEYAQPPYRAEHSPIPMYLMVRGELSPDKDFEEVRKLIYRKVYSIKIP